MTLFLLCFLYKMYYNEKSNIYINCPIILAASIIHKIKLSTIYNLYSFERENKRSK